MQKEVEALRLNGHMATTTKFPNGKKLSSEIIATDNAEAEISFDAGAIILLLPSEKISMWADSDEEGIYFDLATDGADLLKVKVEKDYACLTVREGEDDSDAYVNPNETC
jgi:hypothetical protein